MVSDFRRPQYGSTTWLALLFSCRSLLILVIELISDLVFLTFISTSTSSQPEQLTPAPPAMMRICQLKEVNEN
jgi:hypothetical protein